MSSGSSLGADSARTLQKQQPSFSVPSDYHGVSRAGQEFVGRAMEKGSEPVVPNLHCGWRSQEVGTCLGGAL